MPILLIFNQVGSVFHLIKILFENEIDIPVYIGMSEWKYNCKVGSSF